MSMDAEKTFDKIQHSFMINGSSKLVRDGYFLNLQKGIYQKSTDDIHAYS